MQIPTCDPLAIDWNTCPTVIVQGAQGTITVSQVEIGEIRIRLALFSPDYLADHWCVKGHIVQVLDGQLILEHRESETLFLDAGKTFIVGDDGQPHLARSEGGAKVIIID